jgi:aminoglycoside N3'-acetyltransferase
VAVGILVGCWPALRSSTLMPEQETPAAARARLAADLRSAGVRPGCPLLIHTSLSAVGHVPGGADTVIDALLEAVGPKGTLVLPTLSYLYTNLDSPNFDVRTTPTNLGTIPETFRSRVGVRRSCHPTHSCAALGPDTAALLDDHGKDRSPVGANSPFRRVRDLGGQVPPHICPHAPPHSPSWRFCRGPGVSSDLSPPNLCWG